MRRLTVWCGSSNADGTNLRPSYCLHGHIQEPYDVSLAQGCTKIFSRPQFAVPYWNLELEFGTHSFQTFWDWSGEIDRGKIKTLSKTVQQTAGPIE